METSGEPEGILSTENAILSIFQEQPSVRLTFGQIADALKGEHPDIAGAVEKLVEAGRLWPAGGRRYALPREMGIVFGKIIVRSDGSGFVKAGGDRIEIDRRNTATALDGDTVIVRKLNRERWEGSFQGKVERIVARSRDGVSGIARRRGGKWLIDPVDPSMPRNIPLKTGPRPDIAEGRLIFALLDYTGRRLTAELKKKIGDPGSPECLIDAVVLDHGLPGDFGEQLEAEAAKVASEPFPEQGREDFRELLTVTVDPVDARDFDDAVSIEKAEDGSWTLYVHIADVASYVRCGSLLDREARIRGTSVYLPDRVIPMLPQLISNGACSLRPMEDRATRTVVLQFDQHGERTDFNIVPSIIRSDRRMTYEEALEYLEGEGTDPRISDLFRAFRQLSQLLDRRREERGALDLDTLEYKVDFDDEGWPDGFHPVPSDISHRMIENFMVEANRAVADHCSWTGLPVIYRVHEKPLEESIERLERKLEEFQLTIPGGRIHSPATLRELLEGIEDPALRDLVSEHVLRSLQKAVYLPSNMGHYGLALRSYMHFTSPIRRYPDLLVHQMLSQQEAGSMPSAGSDTGLLADSSSAAEDNAEAAEREATELMALLFLSRKIGSEYGGVVTGVKNFGIFVRLEGIPIEGLAHRKEIRNSGIPFHGPGGIFHEGSVVKVRVLSVDVMERRLSLTTVRGSE